MDAFWTDLGCVGVVHTPAGGDDEIVTTVPDETGRFDPISRQNGLLAALGIVDQPAAQLSQNHLVPTGA